MFLPDKFVSAFRIDENTAVELLMPEFTGMSDVIFRVRPCVIFSFKTRSEIKSRRGYSSGALLS